MKTGKGIDFSIDESRPCDLVACGGIFFDQEFRSVGSVKIGGREVAALTINREERGKELNLAPGGSVINTAVQAVRLGLAAKVYGKIGEDPFGACILDELGREGIDVGGIIRSGEDRTATTVILGKQAGGEFDFAMLTFNGANDTFCRDDLLAVDPVDSVDSVDPIDFVDPMDRIVRQGRVFLLGDFFSLNRFHPHLSEILAAARKAGTVTALDHGRFERTRTASRMIDNLKSCLRSVDLYLPGRDELLELTGKAKVEDGLEMAIQEFGVRVVALKLGAQGCRIKTAREDIPVPPFVIREGVSSVGAGDAFNAVFIDGILRGETDLYRLGREANAAGRLKVRSGKFPNRERLNTFLLNSGHPSEPTCTDPKSS